MSKPHRKAIGSARREIAADDFLDADNLARKHRMRLLCRSESHYQLTDGDWLLNLYPGNCRIFTDKNHGGPYLDFAGARWTLVQVVERAIAATHVDERELERAAVALGLAPEGI